MLTVHHLGKSQSERIVWLCEELAIPYELKCYDRDPKTMLAPADYKSLHPLGAAPVITDGNLILAESAAIVDYILATYGDGRLAIASGDPNYVHYLYWLHFTNGSLQPAFGRMIVMRMTGAAKDNPVVTAMAGRLALAIGMVEARLGEAPYLAGDALSAADIMIVFTLTTMRYFVPFELAAYPNILAYLDRIATRDAYRRAMAKGDPGMALLLS